MPIYMIIYLSIIALGIIVGAIKFPKLTKSSQYFWLLLVATLVTEIIAWIAASMYQTNMTVYRLFAFVQYGLLAWGYQLELPSYARLIRLSMIGIFIIGMLDMSFHISILTTQYHTFFKTLIGILIICWTLFYLRTMITTEIPYSFMEYPLFWLSIGWLVFSVIMLFNFSAFNFINKHNFTALFQQIRIFGNYVLYTIFIVAFLSKQRSLSPV